MASISHNNTHRSGLIAQYFDITIFETNSHRFENSNTTNTTNPSQQTHAALDHIYTSTVELNRKLHTLPRWISQQKLKNKYALNSSSGRGIEYKKTIKISAQELFLLILTVSFVLFITGYIQYISWTFSLIDIINNNLDAPSAKVKRVISSRSELKQTLHLQSLSSTNIKSIEKLLYVKMSVNKSAFWSKYSTHQQNTIVAFTYIQAIVSVTSSQTSDMRESLKLLSVKNSDSNHANPHHNTNINAPAPTKIEHSNKLFPDTSLDIILANMDNNEQNNQLINQIMKEMNKRNCTFRINDDDYNTAIFYSIMHEMNEKTVSEEKDDVMSSGFYDEQFKDLFENYENSQYKSNHSSDDEMDCTFEYDIEQINNPEHKQTIDVYLIIDFIGIIRMKTYILKKTH